MIRWNEQRGHKADITADTITHSFIARDERRAVVLGVPYDLRNEPLPNIGTYRVSADVLPRIERIPPPGGEAVDALVGII